MEVDEISHCQMISGQRVLVDGITTYNKQEADHVAEEKQYHLQIQHQQAKAKDQEATMAIGFKPTCSHHQLSSPSSSPSHDEFSFTISLHSSSSSSNSSTSLTNTLNYNNNIGNNNKPGQKYCPVQGAIDLSPADEIFFKGQLLPLRLLSSLPISPRCSSTNSVEGFATLPIRELIQEEVDHHHIVKPDVDDDYNDRNSYSRRISHNYSDMISSLEEEYSCRNKAAVAAAVGSSCSFNSYEYYNKYVHNRRQLFDYTPEGKIKAKSFSLSSLITKKQKDITTTTTTTTDHTNKIKEYSELADDHKHNISSAWKFKSGVAVRFLKSYMRMMRPLVPFKGTRSRSSSSETTTNTSTSVHLQHNPHCYYYNNNNKKSNFSGNHEMMSPPRTRTTGRSDNSSSNNNNNQVSIIRDILARRRSAGKFSAPSSMRTSPTNSGPILVSSSSASSSSRNINNTNKPSKNSSTDSTMDELQAAIQAAIAHCKNSIAA